MSTVTVVDTITGPNGTFIVRRSKGTWWVNEKLPHGPEDYVGGRGTQDDALALARRCAS